MVKIHGIFYIILSVGILFFSYNLDPKKFSIFIWMGYLFFAVGVAKLVIGFINKKKESRFDRKEVNIFQQQRHMGSTHQRKAAVNSYRQQEVRYCFGCGSRLRGHENFCSMCGQKLR